MIIKVTNSFELNFQQGGNAYKISDIYSVKLF